ncbi:MAG: serine hydrolase domain-containing protein [Bacteroidota bacterium]
MRYLLPLIISLVLMSCDQSQKPAENFEENNTPQDSLTAALTQLHQDGVINGFGVAIVDQDKVLYTNGFGFSDAENQQPYSKNTLQNIASVSKTFIGIALLKAQELGKLNLDDPVSKHLSFDVVNPNFPDQPITIRQLATHTSSITDGAIYNKKAYVLKSPADSLDAEKMEIPKEFNLPTTKTAMKPFLMDVLDKKGKWYVDSIYLNEAPG